MTTLAAEPRPGRGRHRRTSNAASNWTWTLVVGLAYLVATGAYLFQAAL